MPFLWSCFPLHAPITFTWAWLNLVIKSIKSWWIPLKEKFGLAKRQQKHFKKHHPPRKKNRTLVKCRVSYVPQEWEDFVNPKRCQFLFCLYVKGEVSESFWEALMALVFLNFPQTKQWGAQIVRGRWPGWLSLDFQLIIPGYLYRRTTKRVWTPTFGGTSRSTVLESGGQYISMYIWVFPKIGETPPKWMVNIMENPIKMDDLGGLNPLFLETPISEMLLEEILHQLFCFPFGLRALRPPARFVPTAARATSRAEGCWLLPFFCVGCYMARGVNSWFLKEQHPSNTSKTVSMNVIPSNFFWEETRQVEMFLWLFLMKWSNKNRTAGYKFTWEACFVDLMA